MHPTLSVTQPSPNINSKRIVQEQPPFQFMEFARNGEKGRLLVYQDLEPLHHRNQLIAQLRIMCIRLESGYTSIPKLWAYILAPY